MASDTRDRMPSWVRVRSDDWSGPVGRHVIGAGRQDGWASYGRLQALRQMLVSTPGAAIDVGDPAGLAGLARVLGMTAKACGAWLSDLAAHDVIDAECLGRGSVVEPDVTGQQEGYADKVRSLRRNAARGGRPRKGAAPEGDTT